VLKGQFRSHKTPVVCVVDSDRDFPEEDAKSTSKNCEAVFGNEAVEWRDVLHILEARELENLLPQSIVELIVATSPEQSKKAKRLHLVHRDLADFVDMKVGEKLCRFHELSKESPSYVRVFHALEITSAAYAEFKGLEACDS